MLVDIVSLWLEALEVIFDLVNDRGVFQERPVVAEVDRLWLILEDLQLSAGLIVSLLEGSEGGSSASAETEGGLQLAPVELHGRAGLRRETG